MESRRILTDEDLKKVAFRSGLLQSSFNYERMQGIGWTHSILPELEKIYEGDKEGLARSMIDNSTFINTSPPIVTFLMGLLLSLEEKKEDRNLINGLKVALFGPLAGIGDALFWFTILPIVGGISASIASEGSIIGPVIFFIVYLLIFLSRLYTVRLGYYTGVKAISTLKDVTRLVTKSATILGVTVIGGLIASYVHIEVLTQIPLNEGHSISLQKDFFDKIIPNLLPLCYTFLMFYLMKNRKMNPLILILGTFILTIICSFFGIL